MWWRDVDEQLLLSDRLETCLRADFGTYYCGWGGDGPVALTILLQADYHCAYSIHSCICIPPLWRFLSLCRNIKQYHTKGYVYICTGIFEIIKYKKKNKWNSKEDTSFLSFYFHSTTICFGLIFVLFIQSWNCIQLLFFYYSKQHKFYKIWGFHGGGYEKWCLLGCYAVWFL
jgi:hypothetical protein